MARRNLLREHRYATHDFASLEDACAHFLDSPKEPIQAACFGVPGPIIEGEANATNVHWKMREDNLSHALGGARVRLINDLGAAAYGVMHLADSEIHIIQHGAYQLHRGNIAIIAAGTGLGESALVFENGRLLCSRIRGRARQLRAPQRGANRAAAIPA